MRNRAGLCVAAVGIVLAGGAASPAAAGGVMFSLDKRVYVPGEVVRAHANVWLKSTIGGGRLEDGPYFAYLGTSRELPSPPPIPPPAIALGEIAISPDDDGRYGTARLRFTLPDLEPGRYWIVNCNDPCTTTLGDLMSTPVVVAAGPGDARLVTITNRLTERLRKLRHRMVNRILGSQRATLSTRLEEVERRLDTLRTDIAVLRESAEMDVPPDEETSSSLAPILAFVVPAAGVGAVLWRRSRRM